MALAQLVVALCLLALSLGNKDIKADVTSNSVSKKSTHQNNTGQHREQTEEQHNRFARWVFNTPSEEFNALPFSPDEEQENVHLPLEFFVRRSPEKLIARAPPLDKVGGGLYTRELSDPDFEGLDSLRGEAFGINRRYASQHELLPYHNTLKDIRRKRSETQTISELNDKAMQVRRLDKIDRMGFNSGNSDGSFRSFKKKISGPGFNSWQKKYLDETDRSGFSGQKKRNFDEIDRAGFHSLGKKNFDEIDRSGFHHFRRRNFDEIDKSGFRDFGKRDFDEIDRSGFRDFGKRDFDEIDRSGFRDFGKRNFDEIDRSGFRDFGKRSPEQSDNKGLFRTSARESAETYKNENNELGKRNFDEIDRSGFRSFAKRSTSDEKPENST